MVSTAFWEMGLDGVKCPPCKEVDGTFSYSCDSYDDRISGESFTSEVEGNKDI